MQFKTGQIVFTSGVSYDMKESIEFTDFIINCLNRYKHLDWGDLGDDDKAMNNSAVRNNDDRIFAKYNYKQSAIYIITEWDRSVTTVLFNDEY